MDRQGSGELRRSPRSIVVESAAGSCEVKRTFSSGTRTPEEPLFAPGPTAKGGSFGAQLVDQKLPAGQVYTTWHQKNVGDELQLRNGELLEARRRATSLEEEVRTLQQENSWLRKQLDIHNDRDELLRDIRDRVSEVNVSQDTQHSQQRRNVCGSVCSLFGRR